MGRVNGGTEVNGRQSERVRHVSPPLRDVGLFGDAQAAHSPACHRHYFWLEAVCAGRAPSIAFPIASPDSTNSTRRFCARPSAVSFEAMGSVFPNPRASMEFAVSPCCTK